MKMDKEGFSFASVNQETCVDCGLCAKKCPQNKSESLVYQVKKTLAARLKDEKTLYKSASGGAFAGLAIAAINAGWLVYGAAYDSKMVCRHTKATSLKELEPLLSSKYVQSDTGNTFSEVNQFLKEGKKVLYSGTPCQISGLRSFIGREEPNLLLVDILCHGVPSPLIFAKYLELLKKKHNGANVTEFDFRDKRGGWGLGYKYKYKYKYKFGSCTDDPYYMYFLDGHIYRESCYSCHYAQQKRSGDITIADYWGIEKFHPEFYSTKGVSLVLLNTENGENAWDKAKESFDYITSDLRFASENNYNLNAPTKRVDAVRDHVYGEIDDLPVEDYFKRHLPYKESLASIVKNKLPMGLKLVLKTILRKVR